MEQTNTEYTKSQINLLNKCSKEKAIQIAFIYIFLYKTKLIVIGIYLSACLAFRNILLGKYIVIILMMHFNSVAFVFY